MTEILVIVLLFSLHLGTIIAYMVHTQKLVNKIMSKDFYSYKVAEDVTRPQSKSSPLTSDDMYEVQDFAPLNDITNFKQM